MLRGLAVSLVVLFHLGYSSFGRGFLGVDMFFVISGYLIALMYTPQDKLGFFVSRATRLLPAYFATVLATVIAALFVTTPNDFGQVVDQAWFATFFAPNLVFWAENSYFDKTAFKPLLHLWSLGVELQFYVLVPVLCWVLQKTRCSGYILLLIASLASCLLVVGVSPKTSFFWLPFRLWEFLIGVGVATYIASIRPMPNLQWLGVAGLLAVLLILTLPINGAAPSAITGHPGAAAVGICLATAAVLMFGLPAWLQSNPAASTLERLGDWSYSVYLAHFPVIVLILYEPFTGTILKPTSTAKLVLVGVAILIVSAILYIVVEKPFRRGPLRVRWLAGTAAVVLALSAVGTTLQELTIPAAERSMYAAWKDQAPYRCGKLNRILQPWAKTCEITPPVEHARQRIMLVGDSHADSIKTAFAAAAFAHQTRVFFIIENNPLTGGMTPAGLMEEAALRKVNAIVLHYSPGSLMPETASQVVKLARLQNINVELIMPVPVWRQHVPRMFWAAAKGKAPIEQQTLQDYWKTNEGAMLAMSKIEGLKLYDVASLLCDPNCRLMSGGLLLYFDRGHLTLTGASMLRSVFHTAIQDLQKAP